MKFYGILLFVLFLHLNSLRAQNSDTLLLKEDIVIKSPKKATLMSMALPGLGQAYNEKYWKIPVVYAAIGTPLFFALDQQSKFNDFKDAYLKRNDDDPNTVDDKYDGVYTDDNLISLIDFHRANRDLLYVLTGVAYILNIVDAAVDAHLYEFDVSNDLSAIIKPNIQFTGPYLSPTPSMTISLKFGKNVQRNRF